MRNLLGLLAVVLIVGVAHGENKFNNRLAPGPAINNLLIDLDDPAPVPADPVVPVIQDCSTGQCSTGSCGTMVSSSGKSRRDRRRGVVYRQSQPVASVQRDSIIAPAPAALPGEECKDALGEVNKSRAARGLQPLKHDPLLTQAAYKAAQLRAASHIHGHLPDLSNGGDFGCLPSGGKATAAGCGALEPSWGWQSCCWDEPQFTVGGAAWVMGNDGRRYMHIFVR